MGELYLNKVAPKMLKARGRKENWADKKSKLQCRSSGASQASREWLSRDSQAFPAVSFSRDADRSGRRSLGWVRELWAADGWKPPALHTPHSRAANPPLKGGSGKHISTSTSPTQKANLINFDR